MFKNTALVTKTVQAAELVAVTYTCVQAARGLAILAVGIGGAVKDKFTKKDSE